MDNIKAQIQKDLDKIAEQGKNKSVEFHRETGCCKITFHGSVIYKSGITRDDCLSTAEKYPGAIPNFSPGERCPENQD